MLTYIAIAISRNTGTVLRTSWRERERERERGGGGGGQGGREREIS